MKPVVNYADLSPAARKRVDAELARQGTPRRTKPSRAVAKGGTPLVCVACGERFETASETAMNRHQQATGHRRYECDLQEAR